MKKMKKNKTVFDKELSRYFSETLKGILAEDDENIVTKERTKQMVISYLQDKGKDMKNSSVLNMKDSFYDLLMITWLQNQRVNKITYL